MFIGELKVKGTKPLEGDQVEVTFKEDHPPAVLSKELFDQIVSETKGVGRVVDCINHLLARTFLANIAEYKLPYYMIDNVAASMRVLAHNLREQAIKKAFNGAGGDEIPVNVLIENL